MKRAQQRRQSQAATRHLVWLPRVLASVVSLEEDQLGAQEDKVVPVVVRITIMAEVPSNDK